MASDDREYMSAAARYYERIRGAGATQYPIVEKLISMFHIAHKQGVDISEAFIIANREISGGLLTYRMPLDIEDLISDIHSISHYNNESPTLQVLRQPYDSIKHALVSMILMANDAKIDSRRVHDIWRTKPAITRDADSNIGNIDIVRRAANEVEATQALNASDAAVVPASTLPPLPSNLNEKPLEELRRVYNIYKEHNYNIVAGAAAGQISGINYIDAIIRSKTRLPDGTTPYVAGTVDTVINEDTPIQDTRKGEIRKYVKYILESLTRLHTTETHGDLKKLVMVTLAALSKRLMRQGGGSRRTRRRRNRSTKIQHRLRR